MKCGTSLTLACAKCDTTLPTGAAFCFACGHRRRYSLGRLRVCRPTNHQDIDSKTDEFGDEFRKPGDQPVRIPIFDDNVLTLGIAELTQPLPERREERIGRRLFPDHADPGNRLRWLSLAHE